jgi:predicted tellurium resistance membrane protein TerC
MGEAILGLIALTAMEIVLGIDNIIFISIVTARLPAAQRPLAWRLGLGLAMIFRIALLCAISWILSLEKPVFTLESWGIQSDWIVPPGLDDPESIHAWTHFWNKLNGVSVRDLILLGGGLFLVAKSVHEIHHQLEDRGEHHQTPAPPNLLGVLLQIGLLDIIFSLDSVITAVGMVSPDMLWVMVTAVVLSMGVMVLFASRIGEFVHRHPTVKMLALSFLIMIGVMLVAEGIGTHVDKGYIYFAMFFAFVVEMLNIRVRRKQHAKHAPA